MEVRSIAIPAADGYTLTGTLYDANASSALLVAPAMGVRRRFYDAFARHVAERGRSVVTIDYRGIGDSRPPSLRRFRGTMSDWGTLDIPAALDWIGRELRPASLAYAGHSAGGQLVGLAPNADRIDRMLLVCAQSGHWRHWPGMQRYGLAALWVAMPVISQLVGFFPSKPLGLGSEDLPRNVASEWARFGRHREYIFRDHDPAPYARLTAPILAYSFCDDSYGPKAAVDWFLSKYSGAKITRVHWEKAGLGHFGVFRRGLGEEHWDVAVRHFDER
jgi:predicted alpha/beta hydrolase